MKADGLFKHLPRCLQLDLRSSSNNKAISPNLWEGLRLCHPRARRLGRSLSQYMFLLRRNHGYNVILRFVQFQVVHEGGFMLFDIG
jgi:hypothetical protein